MVLLRVHEAKVKSNSKSPRVVKESPINEDVAKEYELSKSQLAKTVAARRKKLAWLAEEMSISPLPEYWSDEQIEEFFNDRASQPYRDP